MSQRCVHGPNPSSARRALCDIAHWTVSLIRIGVLNCHIALLSCLYTRMGRSSPNEYRSGESLRLKRHSRSKSVRAKVPRRCRPPDLTRQVLISPPDHIQITPQEYQLEGAAQTDWSHEGSFKGIVEMNVSPVTLHLPEVGEQQLLIVFLFPVSRCFESFMYPLPIYKTAWLTAGCSPFRELGTNQCFLIGDQMGLGKTLLVVLAM